MTTYLKSKSPARRNLAIINPVDLEPQPRPSHHHGEASHKEANKPRTTQRPWSWRSIKPSSARCRAKHYAQPWQAERLGTASSRQSHGAHGDGAIGQRSENSSKTTCRSCVKLLLSLLFEKSWVGRSVVRYLAKARDFPYHHLGVCPKSQTIISVRGRRKRHAWSFWCEEESQFLGRGRFTFLSFRLL